MRQPSLILSIRYVPSFTSWGRPNHPLGTRFTLTLRMLPTHERTLSTSPSPYRAGVAPLTAGTIPSGTGTSVRPTCARPCGKLCHRRRR